MKLIADSGSTNTDWCIIKDDNTLFYFKSEGINPTLDSVDTIYNKILPSKSTFGFNSIKEVYFYGSGCSGKERKDKVDSALNKIFEENCQIEIASDLMGAAKAMCTHKEGIVCILGTGSNTCYYDGSQIGRKIGGLGYILGDEGSGSFLGKSLLKSYLCDELPDHLCAGLETSYSISRDEVLKNVYFRQGANRYLAKFSHFLYEYKNHPFIKKLLLSVFDLFIEKHILKYANAYAVPIHFVGSIAYFFQEELRMQLENRNLSIGSIVKKPIEALAQFYLKVEQ